MTSIIHTLSGWGSNVWNTTKTVVKSSTLRVSALVFTTLAGIGAYSLSQDIQSGNFGLLHSAPETALVLGGAYYLKGIIQEAFRIQKWERTPVPQSTRRRKIVCFLSKADDVHPLAQMKTFEPRFKMKYIYTSPSGLKKSLQKESTPQDRVCHLIFPQIGGTSSIIGSDGLMKEEGCRKQLQSIDPHAHILITSNHAGLTDGIAEALSQSNFRVFANVSSSEGSPPIFYLNAKKKPAFLQFNSDGILLTRIFISRQARLPELDKDYRLLDAATQRKIDKWSTGPGLEIIGSNRAIYELLKELKSVGNLDAARALLTIARNRGEGATAHKLQKFIQNEIEERRRLDELYS